MRVGWGGEKRARYDAIKPFHDGKYPLLKGLRSPCGRKVAIIISG
jgi:hypothetical protein